MTPAEMLEGIDLEGGWKVIRPATRKPNATGGHFSKGYIVENSDGRQAFLKAMDYMAAFERDDFTIVLNALTRAYLFEKDLCIRCRNKRLDRVVHAIDHGTIQTNPNNPSTKVEYLIFEKADSDIRAHLDAQAEFDLAFALRTLHNVSLGLEQMHRNDMAHQDLKPSNVLLFGSDLGSKIADLGRAWAKDTPAPHDNYKIAGDLTYAPPELLYGHVVADERARRFGCDTYHLGSLAIFIFNGEHANSMLMSHLAQEHRYHFWGGDYDSVLPYLQDAFEKAMSELKKDLPEPVRDELSSVIRRLCEPDPSKRGHLANVHGGGSQFSLERFISIFDRLAFTSEVRLKKAVI